MSEARISKLASEKVRQKSSEDYGRQIGRITTKLMERAAKLGQVLEDSVRYKIRQFDTNAYGSLGAKQALHIEANDESIQILRERVKGQPEPGQRDSDATPGELTGRANLSRYDLSMPFNHKQVANNYVDASFGIPELRGDYTRVLDNPVSVTADTLARARSHIAIEEARQKAQVHQTPETKQAA